MNRRIYDIVYYFRVVFNRKVLKQYSQKYDLEIDNVNTHIQNLRAEIS